MKHKATLIILFWRSWKEGVCQFGFPEGRVYTNMDLLWFDGSGRKFCVATFFPSNTYP